MSLGSVILSLTRTSDKNTVWENSVKRLMSSESNHQMKAGNKSRGLRIPCTGGRWAAHGAEGWSGIFFPPFLLFPLSFGCCSLLQCLPDPYLSSNFKDLV